MIDEQYREAYERAPEETKESILRFMQESKKVRDWKPLLYYVLGSGTPPYKMSKKNSA